MSGLGTNNFALFLLYFSITGYARDIYELKGLTVVFNCPYKGGSGVDVRWSYGETIIMLYSINERINNQTLEPEIYTRMSVVGNYPNGEYNLQISNIRESDEGRYRCNVGSQQDEQTLYLIVAPTSVNVENVTPQDILLGTEGQDLTVSCLAIGGKPPPTVTLMVDGTSISTGNQSATYTLKSIPKSYDRKTATCRASNDANNNNPLSDTAMFYLNLKPLQPAFSLDPVSTEETKPLVVSCTSTGSRPQATFQWTIGLSNVTSNSTTQSTVNTVDDTYIVTSTITYSVYRIHNGQTLTCGAYNNASTSGVVTSKALDVKFAPAITVINMTYKQNDGNRGVSCVPFGNPTKYTYYKWQHKSPYGVMIRELDGGQNGILTLPSVPEEDRYQDSGEYVCTAGNGITGRDGKIEQTGSGFVIINAQPVITSDNKDTTYGELGKNVDLHVYVYSVPKYTSIRWYSNSEPIANNYKYTLSETAALVTDAFHGKDLKSNGYILTLTIKYSVELDFNISYRAEVSNDVGLAARYTILLLSVSAPQTPAIALLSLAESSIVVQWEPGYNGGIEQTVYIEYRIYGFIKWESEAIPDNKQTRRQTYTLSGLQDDTMYEVRMYAENKLNKSLPTATVLIKTIKGEKLSSSEDEIGGVAGGLSVVIVILITIIIVLLILRKQGTRKQRSMAHTSRLKDETSYHNPINCQGTDEQGDTRDQRNKLKASFAPQYETLGVKDNPSTYSDLLTQQDKLKTRSAAEYETLGMTEKPNTYSVIHGRQDQTQPEVTAYHYESLSDQDKSIVYENTNVQKGQQQSEKTNIKP